MSPYVQSAARSILLPVQGGSIVQECFQERRRSMSGSEIRASQSSASESAPWYKQKYIHPEQSVRKALLWQLLVPATYFSLLFISGLNHYTVKSMIKKRSEEHTSELQSRFDLVCRLLLEKKKKET